MVQAIKSVLFFDFDSIYRSLNRQRAGSGEQLGARAGAWLEAIETGELMEPRGEEIRRRFATKRCYADPKVLGKNRGWLTANGVQIVDCPQLGGHPRTPADVHLVLDTADALEHGAEVQEFILLTAEADLTPLLFRLRAHNRRIVVYSTEAGVASYNALADATIPERALLAVLSRSPAEPATTRSDPSIPRPPVIPAPRLGERPAAGPAQPKPTQAPQPAAARPGSSKVPARTQAAIDREVLASLVRRIHQATGVPLFSPKAFGDLFQALAVEVAENGYRFQSTAENVANRMMAIGRNVTKRQIGFVVKGLALRGHVFGPDDEPEALAETFYEQVLYLVESSDLGLNDSEKAMVEAWILGPRMMQPEAAPDAAAAPRGAGRAPAPQDRGEASRPAMPPPRRSAAQAGPQHRPIITPPPAAQPEGRRPSSTRPAAPPRAAARPERSPAAEPGAPQPAVRPAATRNAAGDRLRGAASRPAAPAEPARSVAPDMENTILAAIAEAVDVLVEDRASERSRGDAPPAPQPEARSERPRARAPEPDQDRPAEPAPARHNQAPVRQEPPPARPEPPNVAAESDDIGDEIQRILASYSRNR